MDEGEIKRVVGLILKRVTIITNRANAEQNKLLIDDMLYIEHQCKALLKTSRTKQTPDGRKIIRGPIYDCTGGREEAEIKYD